MVLDKYVLLQLLHTLLHTAYTCQKSHPDQATKAMGFAGTRNKVESQFVHTVHLNCARNFDHEFKNFRLQHET